MTPSTMNMVFDTGPLRHFALHGWLGVLKFLAGKRQITIPESVEAELRLQLRTDSALNIIFDAEWITVDRSNDVDYLHAFAQYAQRLVANGKNRGECGVLTLGKTRDSTVLIIDDGPARKIAQEENLTYRGTLGLLCEAIREGLLTVSLVENLADDLMISGAYRLPFERGGFRSWAEEQGLLKETTDIPDTHDSGTTPSVLRVMELLG